MAEFLPELSVQSTYDCPNETIREIRDRAQSFVDIMHINREHHGQLGAAMEDFDIMFEEGVGRTGTGIVEAVDTELYNGLDLDETVELQLCEFGTEATVVRRTRKRSRKPIAGSSANTKQTLPWSKLVTDSTRRRKPVLIGTLTFEERRAKVAKYLEKRKRRVWNRKITYVCRKKVAD
jgi:hypothetical protein